ncbi:hypothetical protein MMC17_002009 [Xylographa soralifera]|nr:hypothetical protein [Xylographa soralifera]
MSLSLSPSQIDYLVSLILETTGHRHFLPGVLMNPLDRDSLPNDEMSFIPFPLFEGQRHQRPRGASSQYRQALASLRARIQNLEGEVYSESGTDHETLDGSPLDSESLWDTVRPQVIRGGVLLADNYQEMNEEEFRAHHYMLDNYRITYRRHSSISTSPPSPRTILTDGQDRHNSSGHRHLSEPLVNGPPRLPCRSMILEPLSIHDFVREFPSGKIDTFYGSIYGIIFCGG